MITPSEAAARRERGLERIRSGNRDDLPELTVRALGSFNLDLLAPFLVEALERVGFHGSVGVGGYPALAQHILDPSSDLYTAAPDVVALVLAAEDALERDGDGVDAETLVEVILERLPATTVVVVPMGADRLPAEHVLSPLAPQRGQLDVELFLSRIRKLASPRVLVLDWEWRVRCVGADSTHDRRLWYLARMRLGPVGLAHLAELVAEGVAAARGAVRKVCAVDLDDVVWGGIVGEVGLSGLVLGEDSIGLAYQDLQRVLAALRATGVLLAICSKNDLDDVAAVFDRHSGMVLDRGDFSAERVGWQDKATSLQELAAELGVGLDAFVFLDDNPVEREWVRTALPEVAVPELPEDPVDRPDFLRRTPYFQRVTVTDADRGRAESYRSQRLRTDLRRRTPTLDEFLAALEQRVVIDSLHAGSLGRAVQLAQRTNQFNLTARRYSAAEFGALLADPGVEAYTLALADRFGESGIVGLAILRLGEGDAEIDTLLLSCRVLGRGIEDAFLAFLAERSVERGRSRLIGLFVPTGKNERARRFYEDRGFAAEADGRFLLELDRTPAPPPGIEVKVAARA
jgi:FkbH-like protein